jgi:hypothetical protein
MSNKEHVEVGESISVTVSSEKKPSPRNLIAEFASAVDVKIAEKKAAKES